jgi:hypothetical protein
MTTIKEVVSRVRNLMKGSKQDPFLTDRYIYSLILKYAAVYMRRQDSTNKLMKFNSVFQTLPFVELIEVDKVEAHCSGVKSGITIKRTKEKLPSFMQGYWGPIIRTVSSIDGSIELQPTQPGTFTSMVKTTSFKYNTTKYYWFLNGYLYMPNIDWDAILIEGVFEGDTTKWNCDPKDDCDSRHVQPLNVPDFLFAEIESMVLKDLAAQASVPVDMSDDKLNVLR